jgi:hypothetical protein
MSNANAVGCLVEFTPKSKARWKWLGTCLSVKKVIDGVFVKCMSHQTLLAIQQVQRQRYQDNQSALKKAISIYTKSQD